MRVRMGFHIKSKAGPNIGDCLKKKGRMPCYLQKTGWHMELIMENDTFAFLGLQLKNRLDC